MCCDQKTNTIAEAVEGKEQWRACERGGWRREEEGRACERGGWREQEGKERQSTIPLASQLTINVKVCHL